MKRRARALFVTPILPAARGNGLAMRAGVLLDALTTDYDVTVLLVPVAGNGGSEDFVAARAQRLVVSPLTLDPLFALSAGVLDPADRLRALRDYPRPALCRWATGPTLDAAFALVSPFGSAAAASTIDGGLLVLRSYLAPYVAPFLNERWAFRILDLDDDERLTHERLSGLHQLHGRASASRLSASEAAKYAALENGWVPRFDLAFAASELHATALGERHRGHPVAVIPNSVEVTSPSPQARHEGPFRILFVGNLGYEPNVDAAVWFVEEVLPELAKFRAVEMRIVGSHPVAQVSALAKPGVEVCANPGDLNPHYLWADVALAPLRAGGGTRIKILEAFAAGVPVVATSIGAEGLAVRDGEHLLIADRAAEAVAACGRLVEDPGLAARLAARAFELVQSRYSRRGAVERVRCVIAGREGCASIPNVRSATDELANGS
jgi:glycosyltransferase involved in cell wall biosynthesis